MARISPATVGTRTGRRLGSRARERIDPDEVDEMVSLMEAFDANDDVGSARCATESSSAIPGLVRARG